MGNKDIAVIIMEFMKVKGVFAVALVGRDGIVLESSSDTDIDMVAMGTIVATAVGTSESLAAEANHGEFEVLLGEYANGKVLMATSVDYVLAIIADKTAVIGNIRYAVKMNMPDIIRALQQR